MGDDLATMRMTAPVLFVGVMGCTPSPLPPVATVHAEPPPAPIATTSAAPSAPPSQAAPPEPAPIPTVAPEPASTPTPPSPPERQPTATEIKDCTRRGGKIEPVCMLGTLTCVVRYRDAGKRCSDKAQCLGECLYEGEDEPQANAFGRCQRTSDPCGCKAPVVHGRVQPALCAD